MKKTLLFSGMAVGFALLSAGTSRAHLVSGSCPDCSPHSACGSKNGTQFSGCAKYYESEWDFNRDITCPAGTGCSKALCGGKAVTSGWSWSYAPKGGGGSTYAHFSGAGGIVCAP